MNVLSLTGTEFTPSIHFDVDRHMLVFEGVSRPENVTEFYAPIIDWMIDYEAELIKLNEFERKAFQIHLVFKFSYFNSASSKMIFNLLDRIARIKRLGFELIIDWFTEEGDDQMREDGEELSDAVDLPFNFFVH